MMIYAYGLPYIYAHRHHHILSRAPIIAATAAITYAHHMPDVSYNSYYFTSRPGTSYTSRIPSRAFNAVFGSSVFKIDIGR